MHDFITFLVEVQGYFSVFGAGAFSRHLVAFRLGDF